MISPVSVSFGFSGLLSVIILDRDLISCQTMQGALYGNNPVFVCTFLSIVTPVCLFFVVSEVTDALESVKNKSYFF